ncbi:MAG TPA: ADP-ribosylglycohydrolase family protein [Victivallales bacterium]|nr:ADP-ribosylglycohydrolase family protein [Victivallales bacterium]
MLNNMFKKIYGCLIGAAIGDAMGGPVEMLDHDQISREYGKVQDLLYYDNVDPNPHGPWKKDAGSITDDTRLRNLIINAVVNSEYNISEYDVDKEIINFYHNSENELQKDWIEEYYYKAIYKASKLAFGGQPTNAGVMSLQPIGILYLCDPDTAFSKAFNLFNYTDSYSRYSGAFSAALTSAGFIPGVTAKETVLLSLDAMKKYKLSVEGPRWTNVDLYQHVAMENEQLIFRAIEIAEKYNDVDSESFKKEIYDKLLQKYKYDGSETIALSVAALIAAKGDFKISVQGAVNLGRDNDSSATLVGAVTGAMSGADIIPKTWKDVIIKANKNEVCIKEQAENLYRIIQKQIKNQEIINNRISNI